MEVLTFYSELWFLVSSGLSLVYNILSMPFVELFSVDIPFIGSILELPVVSDILQFVFNTLGIGDYSILSIMFGVGIPLMIGYTIIKWFIGIL